MTQEEFAKTLMEFEGNLLDDEIQHKLKCVILDYMKDCEDVFMTMDGFDMVIAMPKEVLGMMRGYESKE